MNSSANYETGRPATLHVGQFIDSMDPGGAEEVVLNLAAALRTDGFRVTIFHFGNPWLAERIQAAGLTSVVLDRSYYKSTLTLPLFIRQFRGVLTKTRVDVLHSHLLGAIFAGSLAARLAQIPAVGTIHDVYSLYDAAMNRRYLRWAERAGCRLVAVCDAMREEVIRVCELDAAERIYNGIDLTRYTQRDHARSAGKAVRIITVARAVAVKRLDLLLDAIALIETDKAFELQIAGDGPLSSELQEQAERLGILDKVTFLGHRKDVPALLASSDIYCLVSDSEGMSVSIVESMAAALPSVVTDVGGNQELVVDGESGFVVGKGDKAALAEKVTQLIDSRQTRSQFGERALARATELFTVDRMCAEYSTLFRQVVSARV